MNLINITFFAVILFFSNYVLADQSEYERGYAEGKKSADRVGNSKTSKENREAKKYELAISYGPDYKEITKQIIFGYLLNQDNSLSFKLGYTDNQSSKHWRHIQLNASFQYKKFISNSFYYSPELVYLDYRAIYSEENSSASGERFNGLGVGIRIGNQWHWDHFTMGCDWFGVGKVAVEFGHKSDNEYFYTLLNTYIGYSF